MSYHINERQKPKRTKPILLGLVLIITGAASLIYSPATQPARQLSNHLQAPAISQSVPSSAKPSSTVIDSYRVAPTLPKYISIPEIGIEKARITQLGTAPNNQIISPGNIYDAGWFKGSARPGQHGAMFIFGHVSSWTANGVFHDLKKLRPGDNITVIRGDDTALTYQVNQLKIYPYDKVDMQAVLSPVNPKVPGLSLMTCTGNIIKGTSEFNQRLVIFASLVK